MYPVFPRAPCTLSTSIIHQMKPESLGIKYLKGFWDPSTQSREKWVFTIYFDSPCRTSHSAEQHALQFIRVTTSPKELFIQTASSLRFPLFAYCSGHKWAFSRNRQTDRRADGQTDRWMERIDSLVEANFEYGGERAAVRVRSFVRWLRCGRHISSAQSAYKMRAARATTTTTRRG